jgi:hypothetical protein
MKNWIQHYLEWNGEAPPKKRGRKPLPYDPSQRDLEMKALFEAGQTLQSIGEKFGETKERVRQVVNIRLGAKPRFKAIQERIKQDAETIKGLIDEGRHTNDIASLLGVSRSYVSFVSRNFGVKVPRAPGCNQIRTDEIEQAVQRVVQGYSIGKACAASPGLRNNVMDECKRRGVQSRHGKWRDFSARHAILKNGIEAGLSYPEIREQIGKAEGKELLNEALLTWAYTHGYRFKKPSTPSAAPLRTVRPKAPKIIREKCAVIVDGLSPREVAIKYYGKTSAAEIAKMLGCTRNSVIGHWFRARKQGQINESAP